MPFELSYAGAGLCVLTPEILEWAASAVPRQSLIFPGPIGWPASSLAGLEAFTAPPRRCGRIGSIYWPAGASRCAVGHFLASQKQLDTIRAAIPDGGHAPLVLNTGSGTVTTEMFMLPPLPLSGGIASYTNDPLFLCTFVDDRYYWWDTVADVTLSVSGDTTTWTSLVTAAGNLLGISITKDTVDTATFGYAPDGLDLEGVPIAAALDALCYACGLRVSRKLDGTVVARNADTDYDTIAANLANDWPSQSGGPFRLDPDGLPETITTADDQPYALPKTVAIAFEADDGQHVASAAVVDQDDLFSDTNATAGRAWTTRRHTYDDATATAYTEAFARDIGIRLISAVSRRYAGIVPWGPDGTSEAVEWLYSTNDAATVIHPAPWSDGITEIVGTPLNAGGTGKGNCTADCFDIINPASLTGTLNASTCLYTPEYDTKRYCGPACVSDTPCPDDPDCTQCLPIYDPGTGGVGKLTGVIDGSNCRIGFTGSPKKYIHGCFTISSTPTPNSIPVIDTTQPFYATIDPAACGTAPVWTYTLIYLRGAFNEVQSPNTTTLHNTSRTAIPPVLPDTTNPSAKAANTAALQASFDSGLNEVLIPPGTITSLTGPKLHPATHSGLVIRGSRPGATTALTTTDELPIGLHLANSNDGDTIGYLHNFARTGTSKIKVCYDGESPTWYPVGGYVYLFNFNSTQNRDPHQQLGKILSRTGPVSGIYELTLDITVNATWFASVGNVKPLPTAVAGTYDGAGTFTCSTHADAAKFAVPSRTCLTDGADINDLYCEFGNATYSNATSGVVRIDPPPRMSYHAGRVVLVPGPWLSDLRIRDLTSYYTPAHGWTDSLCERTNWPGYINPAASAYLAWRHGRGLIDFDACQNLHFDDFDFDGLSFNEHTQDILITNSRVYNYLYCNSGTRRLTFVATKFSGGNAVIGGGANYGAFVQVYGYEDDGTTKTKTHDLKLLYCEFLANAYTWNCDGDRTEVVGCYLAAGQSLTLYGQNCIVEGNTGPGSIILAAGSTGQLGQNTCTITDSTADGWQSPVTADVDNRVTHDLLDFTKGLKTDAALEVAGTATVGSDVTVGLLAGEARVHVRSAAQGFPVETLETADASNDYTIDRRYHARGTGSGNIDPAALITIPLEAGESASVARVAVFDAMVRGWRTSGGGSSGDAAAYRIMRTVKRVGTGAPAGVGSPVSLLSVADDSLGGPTLDIDGNSVTLNVLAAGSGGSSRNYTWHATVDVFATTLHFPTPADYSFVLGWWERRPGKVWQDTLATDIADTAGDTIRLVQRLGGSMGNLLAASSHEPLWESDGLRFGASKYFAFERPKAVTDYTVWAVINASDPTQILDLTTRDAGSGISNIYYNGSIPRWYIVNDGGSIYTIDAALASGYSLVRISIRGGGNVYFSQTGMGDTLLGTGSTYSTHLDAVGGNPTAGTWGGIGIQLESLTIAGGTLTPTQLAQIDAYYLASAYALTLGSHRVTPDGKNRVTPDGHYRKVP